MTDTTPNLALPELIAAQAQKHVTINEALRALDALVQLAVLDRDLAAPPGDPEEGQRWLIAASPTGDWAGHASEIAVWQDDGWDFYAPQTGWLAYVADEGALLAFTGSGWVDAIGALTSLNNMTLLGVGTTADAANPFSAKLNNSLWTARSTAEGGDGNLRYKMSKEASAKTLSLLLQTAYSGRAELGLTGDDNFHIKVSADGSAWAEALSIDRTSGGLRFLANSTDVASATTCDIGAAPSLKVRITGTTTVTSFGSAIHAIRLIRFADALTLTYNSTSLVLPTGADIATAAGDTAIAVSDESGNWRVCHYQRANGMPLVGGTRTYSFMMADQAAVTIPLPAGAQAMTVMLTNNSSSSTRPNGAVFARCTSTATCIKLAFDPAATGVDVTTGALTGTTGTSGHFTISAHSDGNLYLENRTGQARLIGAAVLSFA
jgi:hypothetical protein